MNNNLVKVLVTGGNGQLASCLKDLVTIEQSIQSNLIVDFKDSKELDITKKESIIEAFKIISYDYIINCAAYTNVEQAERHPEKAYKANAEGVKNLAEVCNSNDCILIHISTDYVFDGKKNKPYTEGDITNPINEYGKSKLAGEKYVQKVLNKYFIIRTSWLYSQYGKNFYKVIRGKIERGEKLSVVDSEIGTPTNANDLARFLFQIILKRSRNYGLYHFSNSGEASWYDFANEILKISGRLNEINLIRIKKVSTMAKRPSFSVLNKNKCKSTFEFPILDWNMSLNNLENIPYN